MFRNWVLSFRNAIDYPLRSLIKWRRKLRIVNEPKDRAFSHLKAEERERAENEAQRLRERYHLDAFYAHSKVDNYRENLFYLALLERGLDALNHPLPDIMRVADVGPSHWFYVQGLAALLKWWRTPAEREVHIEGYEIDPNRVYADLRSRYDHALSHIGALNNVRYIPAAFEGKPEEWDMIVMLFPFVFKKDHLKWGLPNRLFDPQELLESVWKSLKPGGVLLVVNQGEKEHIRQKEMMQQLGINTEINFKFESSFYSYDLPRYLIAATKG